MPCTLSPSTIKLCFPNIVNYSYHFPNWYKRILWPVTSSLENKLIHNHVSSTHSAYRLKRTYFIVALLRYILTTIWVCWHLTLLDHQTLFFLPPYTQGVKKLVGRAGIEPRASGSASDLFNKNLHWGFFHIHDSFQAYVYLQDQSTCSFRTFSSKFGTQVLAFCKTIFHSSPLP